MNLATQSIPNITFEQYLTGEFDCPWADCLWVEGEIISVPPEYGENNEIAQYLFFQFRLHIIHHGLTLGTCMKDTDIEVVSTKHRTRKPDVMVIASKTRDALRGRSAVITTDMAPPLIIVEVISKNYRDVDVVDKHQEYLDRRVPEYWTVDWDCPEPHIIVRTLDSSTNRYLNQSYTVGDTVQSAILPTLLLKVEDILSAQ